MLPLRSNDSESAGAMPETSAQAPSSNRIEIKPRLPLGKSTPPVRRENQPADLQFTCPNCLHMLSAARQAVSTALPCPTCGAWVMPPQVVRTADADVSSAPAKSSLPPPRKTGSHTMLERQAE